MSTEPAMEQNPNFSQITPTGPSSNSTTPAPNPLQKYFREPGIHIRLPSKGRFCQPGDLELSINGELAVFPMTTGDELVLRSPDGLLNGDAVEKIIKSCCPGIKNVRTLVSPDVDAILLAIRTCTYGEDMSIDVDCPKCSHQNSFTVNIDNALSEMSFLDDNYEVYLDKTVKIFLTPYTYEGSIKATLAAFEETKLLRSLADEDTSEDEKTKAFGESFLRLSTLNIDLMVESIEKVIVPEGEVTDKAFIREFVNNIEKKKVNIIDEQIKEINQVGANRSFGAKCQECEHEWETQIAFDPAHFFE